MANVENVSGSNVKSRIFGGNEVEIEDYPFMVQIHTNNPPKFHCGGSLITRNCVLSAAHCLDKTYAETRPLAIKVYGGSRSLDTLTSIERDVVRIITPAEYDTRTYDMDLAILVLESPMDGENTGTIEILSDNLEDTCGNVTVFGWGASERNIGLKDRTLKAVNLDIINNSRCEKLQIPLVAENMFCAISRDDTQRNACDDDAGGPAVCDNKVAGVFSWGEPCPPLYGNPGVYARFDTELARNFLQSNIERYCVDGEIEIPIESYPDMDIPPA